MITENTDKNRVLVVDDDEVNIKSAKQTLAWCDLTVCTSYSEAEELLLPKYDDKRRRLLRCRYEKKGLDETTAYERASKETRCPYWDVVLCDLLMPAGGRAQCDIGRQFIGQEMVVGWALALNSVKNGARYVAVVTDINHHEHPASALLDFVNSHVFQADKSKLLLTNYVPRIGIKGTEVTCRECSGTGKVRRQHECYCCKGTGVDYTEKGKDWGRVLDMFVRDSQIVSI